LTKKTKFKVFLSKDVKRYRQKVVKIKEYITGVLKYHIIILINFFMIDLQKYRCSEILDIDDENYMNVINKCAI
jgi:hypothetical protein